MVGFGVVGPNVGDSVVGINVEGLGLPDGAGLCVGAGEIVGACEQYLGYLVGLGVNVGRGDTVGSVGALEDLEDLEDLELLVGVAVNVLGLPEYDGAGERVGYLVDLNLVGAGDTVGVGRSMQSPLASPLPLPPLPLLVAKMLLGMLSGKAGGDWRLREWRRPYPLVRRLEDTSEAWTTRAPGSTMTANATATNRQTTHGRRRRFIFRVHELDIVQASLILE